MFPALTDRHSLVAMLDELTHERLDILDQCATLSAAQLADPVYPGTWPILKILAHLASSERFILAHVYSRPHPPAKEALPKEPPHDLGAIRTALDEANAEALAWLKSYPESVLGEACVYDRNAEPATVGGLFFHIVRHELGHRAFLKHKLKKLQGS